MNKLHPIFDMATPQPEAVAEEVPVKTGPPAKAKPFRPMARTVADEAGAAPKPVARAKPPRPARPLAKPLAKRDGFALPGEKPDLAAELPRKARPRRSIGLWASFLMMVALPTLAAGLYYGLVVSNQYQSEFRFAVRSQDFAPAGTTAASTALGAAARGMGIFTDNFLVVDYLSSRQAVDDLLKTVDLRQAYSRGDTDPLSRLRGRETMENLVTYWQSMIDASFDLATGLALVRVRAFTAEDAYKIASTLVSQSERLINDISARARRDAVKFAEADVSRAEERLRGARAAMRQFRDTEQTPDAARTAGGTLDLSMKLRGELAGLQSQLASLRTYMDPSAPTVRVLESRIAATQKQITSIEREIGKGGAGKGGELAAGTATGAATAGGTPALSDVLSNYEDVDLSRQFAEKYYDTTLSALELARSEAAAQQTYVATYVQPALAQASEYPRRVVSTLIVFLAAGALWFISVMVFFSIRDHVA